MCGYVCVCVCGMASSSFPPTSKFRYYNSNSKKRQAMDSSSRSYYKDYIRRRDHSTMKKDVLEQKRGLTDRAAYMSFLEVQLERVSAACMTSEAFSDRIEQIQSQVMTMEKKISNLSSAMQLSQKYSEEGVKDFQNVARELKNLKTCPRGN